MDRKGLFDCQIKSLGKVGCFSDYTANVNRQTTDKLLFLYAIITGENV